MKLESSDLDLAVTIIDACASRGAFKGSEMATVGILREKFENASKALKDETELNTEDETSD